MSTSFTLSCPVPVTQHKTIVLGHGSGRRLTAQLVRDLFLPAFDNPALRKLDDQAVLNIRLWKKNRSDNGFLRGDAVFFPGGDICRLAVWDRQRSGHERCTAVVSDGGVHHRGGSAVEDLVAGYAIDGAGRGGRPVSRL